MKSAKSRLIWIGLLMVSAAIGVLVGWALAESRIQNQGEAYYRKLVKIEQELRRRDRMPAEGRAEFVAAVDLIANPQRYDNRRIVLQGVWNWGFEDSTLDLESAAQNFGIWVDPDWESVNQPMGDFSEGGRDEETSRSTQVWRESFRIVAEGTFRFRESDAAHPGGGFGHFGVSEAYFKFDRLFRFQPASSGEPNQTHQHNAGDRPPMNDSPASDTPSSPAPRG